MKGYYNRVVLSGHLKVFYNFPWQGVTRFYLAVRSVCVVHLHEHTCHRTPGFLFS